MTEGKGACNLITFNYLGIEKKLHKEKNWPIYQTILCLSHSGNVGNVTCLLLSKCFLKYYARQIPETGSGMRQNTRKINLQYSQLNVEVKAIQETIYQGDLT